MFNFARISVQLQQEYASAMSAGTIWSMSGDKIYMDYSSSLGPIDPQVPNLEGKLVPALGYIDKVDEFIGKSKVNNLSPAEYMFLKGKTTIYASFTEDIK